MNNHKSFSFNIQISDYCNAWFTGILALVIMVELFGVVIHHSLKEQDICIPTHISTEFNNRGSNNNIIITTTTVTITTLKCKPHPCLHQVPNCQLNATKYMYVIMSDATARLNLEESHQQWF